eukprot:1888125-Pyramimonas_sp.AAC.1
MRLVSFLDGVFARRLQEIISSWERNPHCERMRVTINVFLPKPGGGTRPIGLLCFWARIWSRCRRQYVKSWEVSVDAKFFWGKDATT